MSERPKRVDACGLDRREFLAMAGLGASAVLAGAGAAGDERADFERLIPADKGLDPSWVAALSARGTPEVYRGPELKTIGMPVGGLCAGQVYLGGDGTLWRWDIFNQIIDSRCDGPAYRHPYQPESPIDQGFAIEVEAAGTTRARRLDGGGFADVRFRGEYPIGRVAYRDESSPVAVDLEAFSPFIPLDVNASSLPATILRFTVTNTSGAKVRATLAGWLQNGACLHSAPAAPVVLRDRVERGPKLTLLACGAAPAPADPAPARERIVFADFEGDTYGDWAVAGEAFGAGPARGALGDDQRLKGFRGKGLVNTYFRGSDGPKGALTSPAFRIPRRYISVLVGGGRHPGETCINLRVGGAVVRTATARDSDAMAWTNWDVRDLEGQEARIEIVDAHSGGWGHIDVDQVEFGDEPRGPDARLEDRTDYGTMGLALLDPAPGDLATAAIDDGARPAGVFAALRRPGEPDVSRPSGRPLCGALGRELALDPGQAATVTFVVTWCFPNLVLPGLKVPGGAGRHYATRFADAGAVARHVADHFEALATGTRLWVDTWYDSTLPYWFLDRTFLNASTLATSTSHRLRNGRFYGWEGVGSCPGTCTHVWQYAQAVARLFPALERSAREQADFADGIGFDPRTGIIDHRGEFRNGPAVDGQAGTILRAYREHQMSADDAFLRRLWPKVKAALEYLMDRHDPDGDGILTGWQHNTLDAPWAGEVPWLSILYLAAVRAGEAMAGEVGDGAFAGRCRAIAERGRSRVVERLWDGDYFVMRPDPRHPDSPGTYGGCHIDQVFGQSWADQVGLGRIIPEANARQALRSLWRYNFAPDVGPYRARYTNGRWYAVPGEAGMIMCTFPRGGDEALSKGNRGFAGYLNECMAGFEYQVAAHMLREGMVTEGLALTRAIHDRYRPSKRNPYNEIECGDHYARSMASYGVFLAACGFESHGPRGRIGFAPRLTPDRFRAPFTAAEGWGTFSQERSGATQRASIAVRRGRLLVRELAFAVPPSMTPTKVVVRSPGERPSRFEARDGRVTILLDEPALVEAGQAIDVEIS